MGRGLPELSGLAAAHAVIANPKLILADEPTGNLHSSPRVINLAGGWGGHGRLGGCGGEDGIMRAIASLIGR